MTDAPVYISSQAGPQMPRVGIEPTAIPQLPNEVGAAVAQLGVAASAFAAKMENAKVTTDHLMANGEYLNGLDKLRDKYAQDPDWQTAPARFAADAKQLQSDTLDKYQLTGRAAAMTTLTMDRATISAGRHVDTIARSNGFAATDSAVTAQGLSNQNAALVATTPLDREDAIHRQAEAIETARAAGWYSPAQAAEKMQAWRSGLDHGEVVRDISGNPVAAAARLQDPKNYPTLSPQQRETYLDHARGVADRQGIETARGTVTGAPYAGSLIAGQFVDSAHVDQLFDRQIVPQESGGQNLPPNSKGAFGPAQITPGFARDYASKLPEDMQARLGSIKGLSDQELTAKLMNMPDVSTALGKAGFRDLAQRYNNPVLAMAAYNAGPKNADRWQAAAVAKFGPSPTPDQVASVIDFPETRNYVASVYTRIGARGDAYGVSPAGRFGLGSAVGNELTQEQTRQQHILNQIASVSASSDPIPKLIGDGMDVGAERIVSYRAAQTQAAAGGDLSAAKNLRDLDFALSVKPQVDQLYRLPFAAMNAAVDHAEAQARESGADFSPDQVKTLAVLQKTRDTIAKARNEDPTSLIVRAGVGKFVPVDTAADPADPAFRASLQARGAQAEMAQKLYAGRALAFSPAEAASLKERYGQAGPDEQFRLLASMASDLPPAVYRDTVNEIVGNAPGAQLVGQFAATRPELAREMLAGAHLLKDRKDTAEKATLVEQTLDKKLGGQIYPTPDQQQALIQGALAVDAARRAQGGTLYQSNDASGIEKAIDDIAGTTIARNGVKVPLPPTMQAGVASDLINHFDDRALELAGGALDRNGRAMRAADISRYGKWRPLEVGGSRYVLDMPAAGGDAPVLNYNGQSLVVDLAGLAQLKAPPAGAGASPAGMQRSIRATIAGAGK